MVQKLFLSVRIEDFCFGFGKLQHNIPDELLKYIAKASASALANFPLGDQRRMAFFSRGETFRLLYQLLSDCLLPSVRFMPTLLRLAIQHIVRVPRAALAQQPQDASAKYFCPRKKPRPTTGSTGIHSRPLQDFMPQSALHRA